MEMNFRFYDVNGMMMSAKDRKTAYRDYCIIYAMNNNKNGIQVRELSRPCDYDVNGMFITAEDSKLAFDKYCINYTENNCDGGIRVRTL